jgi:hypothetical protein
VTAVVAVPTITTNEGDWDTVVDPGSGVQGTGVAIREVDDDWALAAEAQPRAEARPAPPAPAAPAPSPSPSPDELVDEIIAVVGAALEATLPPLLEPLLQKQRDLEDRLIWLKQDVEAQEARRQAAAIIPPAPPTPQFALTPVAPAVMPAPVVPAPPVRAATVSATTFGLVTVPPPGPRRSQLEIALEQVGPVDVPDFGRSRRVVGTVLVGFLLALVVAAIAAAILSHT